MDANRADHLPGVLTVGQVPPLPSVRPGCHRLWQLASSPVTMRWSIDQSAGDPDRTGLGAQRR